MKVTSTFIITIDNPSKEMLVDMAALGFCQNATLDYVASEDSLDVTFDNLDDYTAFKAMIAIYNK